MQPPDEPASTTSFRRRALPALLFVLLPLLLIWPGFQRGKVLFGINIVGGFYHLRGAIGASLAEGRLPVWDAHTRCGAPLLAAMHGGVLYPLTWPAALMDPDFFWTFTVWVHLGLAGAFAFAWLSRGLGLSREGALAGALLYMLCGFFASNVHYGHIPHISTFPWAAAVMWRLEMFFHGPTLRKGMFLAAALALMILAGFPQYVYIAGFAVAARLAHFVLAEREGRKDRGGIAVRAIGAMALAGALAAPQLLPTIELMGHTQRVAVGNYEFVTSFSMPPSSLATLAAPRFLGDPRNAPTDSSIFISIAGLSLAVLGTLGRGRGKGLWIGLGILGLVLAMGHYTPLFRVFFHLVPGVSWFRVPARFLLIFILAAAPLAAMGVERLRNGDDFLRRHSFGVAVVAGALLLGALGIGVWSGAWLDRGIAWAVLTLAVVAGVFLLYGRALLGGRAAAAALGLVLIAELVGHNSVFYAGFPKDEMEWPAEFVDKVRNHPRHPFRIATVTGEQTPAIGKCQLAGIDHVGGYDPMMLRRYTELCNVARGKPETDVIVAMVLARPAPLFDLLGARWWIVPGARQEPPGWKTVGQLQNGFVYENPRAMPRAFFVGRAVAIESPQERLKFLSSPAFDYHRMAVVESAADAAPTGPEEVQGKVQLAAMGSGAYELRTECADDAYLVLSESYYPGWTAEVDGAPAPVLRADHLLQAVRLPAGRHEVRFRYRSRFLGLGFALAAAGVVVPLGLILWRRRRP